MAKKKSTEKQEQSPLKFEEALDRLETIVQKLEDGELGLEEALAAYEEGVGHLKGCYQALGRAERKIELLASIDAQGHCETEPFEEAEMSLEEKRDNRSRRRSSGGAAERPRRPTRETGRETGRETDETDDAGSLF